MEEYHTFPISEAEARKLDTLTISSDTEFQGRARAADQWVRANPSLAAGIALLLGYLVGRALKT